MITKAQAIMSLRPNVEWTMNGDNVENIIWHTEGIEPLTEAEVIAELNRLELVKQVEQDAKAAAKESAKAKLAALGLSEVEILALVGE